MNIRTFIATTLPAMAFFVAQPAAASTLIGQTVDYCTDSTYAGAVSNDPALCDFGSVFVAGTATIDASVEIILDQGGTRRLDFFTDTLDIIYEDVGSFSPDLFVVTGFTAPISGILWPGGFCGAPPPGLWRCVAISPFREGEKGPENPAPSYPALAI